MKDIWLISDTHFGHQAILTFKDRQGNLIRGSRFDSVQQMNECMLDNWNSVVKPGDHVYHLGDLMMMDKQEFSKFFPRLNGSKRLVVGNHDDIKFLAKGEFFSKIMMWRIFKDFGLMLTHTPTHYSNLLRLTNKTGKFPEDCTCLYNIHGHIHQNPSPRGPYRNVSVEAIDYTPIHIETLRDQAQDYMNNQYPSDREYLMNFY